GADFAAGFLRVAWRCERAHGEPHSKRSQTLLQVDHDESPSVVTPSHDTSRCRGRTRFDPSCCNRLILADNCECNTPDLQTSCVLACVGCLRNRKPQDCTNPGNQD